MSISELQGMVNNEGLFEVDSMLRFSQFKTGNDGKTNEGNDKISSPEEKTLLMERALDIYWSKRRVTKVLDVEPPQKAMHFDEAICEAEDSSSDTDIDTSLSSDEDLHI